MEVADDGDADAALVETFDDGGDGRGGFFVVDRDAHDLRAGEGQGCNLLDGAGDVGCVGVGHGLDDDRDFPADANLADFDRWGFSAMNLRHASSLPVEPAASAVQFLANSSDRETRCKMR